MECRLYENGRCGKWDKRHKCNPIDGTLFDDEYSIVSMEKACEMRSIFGNYFFTITEDDIKEMREGKVFAVLDEYGIFLRLEGRE